MIKLKNILDVVIRVLRTCVSQANAERGEKK